MWMKNATRARSNKHGGAIGALLLLDAGENAATEASAERGAEGSVVANRKSAEKRVSNRQ
jgi:hypothetical protein